MSNLKPFDVVVALKIGCNERRLRLPDQASVQPQWDNNTVGDLAESLFKGKSEVSRSINRLVDLGLIAERPTKSADPVASNRKLYALNRSAMTGLLIHGIRHIFTTTKTGYGRGMATAWHCPLLHSAMNPPEVALVWSRPGGTMQGELLEPLYAKCADAAEVDSQLYALLALIDIIRTGKPRELKYAAEMLEQQVMELHS